MTTTCYVVSIVERWVEHGVMWDGVCGGSSLHSTRWDVRGPLASDDLTMDGVGVETPAGASCDRCSTPVPWDAPDRPCGCSDPECTQTRSGLSRFGGQRIVWSTASGKLEPGAMYFGQPHRAEHGCFDWDNCDGRHLHVVLPNGHPWDIDSRANNCDRKDDRTHRCWVREGDPPNVTAGKTGGNTCTAGGGSILSGSYHGFLRNGVLDP